VNAIDESVAECTSFRKSSGWPGRRLWSSCRVRQKVTLDKNSKVRLAATLRRRIIAKTAVRRIRVSLRANAGLRPQIAVRPTKMPHGRCGAAKHPKRHIGCSLIEGMGYTPAAPKSATPGGNLGVNLLDWEQVKGYGTRAKARCLPSAAAWRSPILTCPAVTSCLL